MTCSRFCIFNNGLKCPLVGFGTWRALADEAYLSVKKAIDVGYRHIDTAFVYGNEVPVGKAINEKIEEGLIKREDIFVVSKLNSANHRRNMVVPALKKSLENLNLQYLDLYLIHAPWSTKPKIDGEVCLQSEVDEQGKEIELDIDPIETWKGMEECVELGLAKSIGLSNFNSRQSMNILSNCSIKPATNQVECHHFLNQEELLRFSEKHGVTITAYRSLGGDKNKHIILGDENIKKLATKYGKTPAQIELRWMMQRGIIVLPKSVNSMRIKENFDLFDFNISDEDMALIMSLNCNKRYCEFSKYSGYKQFPFPPDLEF